MPIIFLRSDYWSLAKRKAGQIVGWLLLLSLAGAGLFLLWRAANKPLLVEYQGTIVEKWAGYSETNEGSRPYYRLRIETEPNNRIAVPVDAETYNRAQVGMWIKKTVSEIELLPEPIRDRNGG